MTRSATFATLSPGKKPVGGRLRGALLGLAAATPAAAVLFIVGVDQASSSSDNAAGWAALTLLALLCAGLGAWIGALGLGRVTGNDTSRLAGMLRALSSGDGCERLGGPYPQSEFGDLARAVDGTVDRFDELRETLERHRLLAELSNDVFLRLAPDATFLSVSPPVTRMLGYEPQEMVGRACYDFLHPDDLSIARKNHDALLSGGTPSSTLRFRRKTGGYVSVELTSRLRRDQPAGRAVEILGLVRDMSERTEHARELERARRDAATTGRSRSSFLAHMSHDLRTPLNIIIGLSQIIRDQMFGPVGAQRYVDYARDIESSGHDLLDLINDLLDLSKVESGRWQLEERAVSLARNVEAVFTMVSARARLAQVTMDSNIEPDLPLLLADERAVRQMLLNVVSTTLKRVTPASVMTVEGRVEQDQLVLVVQGAARPVESRDGYAKDSLDGSVGLTLASDLMRLHGGRLDLQTAGGRFVVTATFPVERSLAPQTAAPASLRLVG